MKNTDSLQIMLKSLCLSSFLEHYDHLSHKAEAENWSFKQYLKALVEQEVNDRSDRRITRLLKRSCLPEGKSLATLDQKLLPEKVRRQLPWLCEGDFVERAENVLAFGLPGTGKTHMVTAIGRELVFNKGMPVLFCSTRNLVERLLRAKQDLELEKELKKLDKFPCIILDDIGYVQQSREEMEVLFAFLSERYERRSLMITSNLVFSEWDKIFKNPMTTAAAIDRLVHHSIIMELDNDSFRAREAKKRKGNKRS